MWDAPFDHDHVLLRVDWGLMPMSGCPRKSCGTVQLNWSLRVDEIGNMLVAGRGWRGSFGPLSSPSTFDMGRQRAAFAWEKKQNESLSWRGEPSTSWKKLCGCGFEEAMVAGGLVFVS